MRLIGIPLTYQREEEHLLNTQSDLFNILMSQAWWYDLTVFMRDFAAAVDPENAARIDRFSPLFVFWVDGVRDIEVLCLSDDGRDAPHFTIQIYPDVRVIEYGIGVG